MDPSQKINWVKKKFEKNKKKVEKMDWKKIEEIRMETEKMKEEFERDMELFREINLIKQAMSNPEKYQIVSSTKYSI